MFFNSNFYIFIFFLVIFDKRLMTVTIMIVSIPLKYYLYIFNLWVFKFKTERDMNTIINS